MASRYSIPNIYRVAAVYEKMTEGHDNGLAPRKRGSGMTRCYVLNVIVPEVARPGYGFEWKGASFVG
jgi:hypothetical protein